MRFLMLREMFRAVALQSGWIYTVSNWALGTTEAYMGLLVANLDKIQTHLGKGMAVARIWLRFGVRRLGHCYPNSIRLYSVLNGGGKPNSHIHLASFKNPQQFGVVLAPGDTVGEFFKRVTRLAIKEFTESRPWAFRELAECGAKKGESDLVYVPKTAACCAQMTFAFLIVQYILLGVAIFWPFARIR